MSADWRTAQACGAQELCPPSVCGACAYNQSTTFLEHALHTHTAHLRQSSKVNHKTTEYEFRCCH
eukprot:scaffold108127_cov28-Tisochrysis_lutea.AAC.3